MTMKVVSTEGVPTAETTAPAKEAAGVTKASSADILRYSALRDRVAGVQTYQDSKTRQLVEPTSVVTLWPRDPAERGG